MNTDRDVLATAASWRAGGHGVALATVLRTWGSAPRAAGSHMAVREDGAFCGSVSGGCVEGAVVDAAREVIRSGDARSLSFGVTDEMAWEVGLACGGKVAIWVGRVASHESPLTELVRALDAARPVVLATRLTTGEQAVLFPMDRDPRPDARWPADAARLALLEDRPSTVADPSDPTGEVFLRPYNPPVRLIVVGAVHIAAPLAQMAAAAGVEVHVVDPRSAFATDERFPGVRLVRAWPRKALETVRPDHRTAVVTLTHDAKLDDPALEAALATSAFYIGALGSRRTHAKRLARLRERGASEDAIARIRAPVGLDVGARTPAEIAVSILAELVAELRGGALRREPSSGDASRERSREPSGGPRVGAIVLAAGRSRRMGALNKLLVDVDGTPMVRRTVQAVLGAGVDPVVVVLGHDADAVRGVLADLPVRFTLNPDHAEGIAASVRTGIRVVTGAVDAALIVLGDMPWIETADVRALVDAFGAGGGAGESAEGRAGIFVPVVAGARGNPVLWSARWFPALERLEGDVGGREILAAHAADVREVPVSGHGVLRDVDTPDALEAIRAGGR